MVNCLSIAGCVLGMVGSALFAYQKYRSVYILTIVNGFIFAALDAAVALSSPEHAGVAVLIIPSLWAVATAAFGLYRIGRMS